MGQTLKNLREIVALTRDILHGANQTVWGGPEGVTKAATVVKTGLTGADVVIGTGHALEDASCGDVVCATIDVIGSVSSAVGLVLGNMAATKKYGTVTGAITVGCRTVRWYCKNYGTFWGCTIAAGHGIANKFTIPVSKP